MKDLLDSPLFAGISREGAEKMLHCAGASARSYRAGALVFSQADKPTNLFLLLEGQVRVSKHFPSGKRNLLFTVEPGQVFGESFAFTGQDHYWYDAQATQASTLLILPQAFVYGVCGNVCEHHKRLIRNMLGLESQTCLTLTKKLHFVTGTTVRQKLALWLLDQPSAENVVRLRMTREELADYLGVTRPSLSRTLAAMQDDGLLRVSGKRIALPDRDALEAEL